MRFLLIVLTALLISTTQASSLSSLKTFFKKSKALSAHFTQTVVDKQGKLIQQSAGTLIIQRPGKFHWRYTAPYPSQIVSDGQKVWIYDPDLKQVTIKNLHHAIDSSPAALLAGSNNLEKDYDIKRDITLPNGQAQLEAIPKSKDSTFQSIQITLAQDNIERLELVDQLEQTTAIQFNNIKLNPAIKSEEFMFIAPHGVDILSE